MNRKGCRWICIVQLKREIMTVYMAYFRSIYEQLSSIWFLHGRDEDMKIFMSDVVKKNSHVRSR